MVIGWGTSVKIASIRTNHNRAANGTQSSRHVPTSSMNRVDIVASFQTSYLITGMAPFGDVLVVLAYIPGEEGEKDFSITAPSRQVCSHQAECTYTQFYEHKILNVFEFCFVQAFSDLFKLYLYCKLGA